MDGFTVNKKGEIRFGLSGIKGMSDAAVQAIIAEREANGPYSDIYSLVERVPSSSMNKKALECLAISGGLDGFGLPREQYVTGNSGGYTFIDMLSRYGNQYQSAKAEAANSLFGDFGSVEITKPKPVQAEEWSAIERLNRERDLVGIYLSAHPLDEYAVVLKNLCNKKCMELGKEADKEELAKLEVVTVGGIVTDLREGFTKRGTPFGIVTLEDYEGAGELAFFDDWAQWRGKFIKGSSLYIKMKFEKKFPTSSYIGSKVLDVEYLVDVRDKFIRKLTLLVNVDDLTELDATELVNEIEKSPGQVEVDVLCHSVKLMRPVNLVSQTRRVGVSKSLIDFLDSKSAIEYRIN